jgi:bifunctional lysine-specific demethylase and histidyl-hydroxylase NO66
MTALTLDLSRGQAGSEEFDVQALFHPVGPQVFLQEHWDRKPLLIQRDAPHYYARLLSESDVDGILRQGPSKNGEYSLRPNPLTAGSLENAYAQGTTQVLFSIQDRWPPLARLCRGLELLFGYPVRAQLFVMPKPAEGIHTHFHGFDHFVWQLAGRRRWRVYEEKLHLPLEEQAEYGMPASHSGQTLIDAELAPGDLIYFPRGFPHEAVTSTEPTLHLRVDFGAYRWVDLLLEAVLAMAHTNPQLREKLPRELLTGEVSAAPLQAHWERLRAALARHANVDLALDRLRQQFVASLRALPEGDSTQSGSLEEVNPDTVVRKRPGMICWVGETAGMAQIDFPGGHLNGPGAIRPVLEFVARAEEFRVRDLPDPAEDQDFVLQRFAQDRDFQPVRLTDKSRVILVRRLVEYGLLSVVGPVSGSV